MNENIFLNQIKQIGIGLAFIIFPILFVFAFAVHPELLSPHMLRDCLITIFQPQINTDERRFLDKTLKYRS